MSCRIRLLLAHLKITFVLLCFVLCAVVLVFPLLSLCLPSSVLWLWPFRRHLLS